VSWSLKTVSPARVAPFWLFASEEARSKICVPLLRVERNDSSSDSVTSIIRSRFSSSSGYCGDIAPIADNRSSFEL